jgi:hypothetical protein
MKRDEFVDYWAVLGCPYFLLARNHARAKPMLTVQARIYKIANRNEMIVLAMQNVEASAL